MLGTPWDVQHWAEHSFCRRSLLHSYVTTLHQSFLVRMHCLWSVAKKRQLWPNILRLPTLKHLFFPPLLPQFSKTDVATSYHLSIACKIIKKEHKYLRERTRLNCSCTWSFSTRNQIYVPWKQNACTKFWSTFIKNVKLHKKYLHKLQKKKKKILLQCKSVNTW